MLPGKRYSVEDVLYLAWRWRWLIVVPWVVVAVVSFVVVRRLPNVFRSESLIQVVPPRVPEGYVRSLSARLGDRLPVISQQIMSRTRLERVIQDFDLYAEDRKDKLMEDVVTKMRDDVGVQIVKGDAFLVSYLSSDAQTATKVTERLASLFIEENLRDREGLAEGANQFLESQLDEARRKLVEHETKLADYKRQYNGELPSQTQANLQVIGSTQSQVQGLSESVNRDRDRRLMLERMLADAKVEASAATLSPAPATPEPETTAAGSAAAQLDAARAQLRGVELRLKPEHPDVIRMKRTIKELEKKAEAEALQAPITTVAAAPPPADVSRQNKVADLRAELDNLDKQIAHKTETQTKLEASIGAYQQRVEASSSRELDLIGLTRDYETLQRMYTSLLMKSQEAQVAANVERRQIGEQFKVIDPARVPERPYSPDRPRLYGAGAVAGLLFGLGMVALIELRNTTFRTEQDVVTVLALPVLATVPAIVTSTERRLIKRRRLITVCVSASFVVCGVMAAVWKFGDAFAWWR